MCEWDVWSCAMQEAFEGAQAEHGEPYVCRTPHGTPVFRVVPVAETMSKAVKLKVGGGEDSVLATRDRGFGSVFVCTKSRTKVKQLRTR